jgi:hypothetical protein
MIAGFADTRTGSMNLSEPATGRVLPENSIEPPLPHHKTVTSRIERTPPVT